MIRKNIRKKLFSGFTGKCDEKSTKYFFIEPPAQIFKEIYNCLWRLGFT